MEKPKILFHGSSSYIEDRLIPRQANDNAIPENSQIGVYATEVMDIAKAMSFRDRNVRHGYMSYSKKPYQLICVDGSPDIKLHHFLYTVSSETFDKTSINSQWISRVPVKILQRIHLPKDEISKYWRRAISEEIKKII